MQAPGVSGAHTYQELCIAARNDERRIAELAKRQHYRKPSSFPEPRQQDGSRTERVPNQETGQRAGPRYDRYRGPQVSGPSYHHYLSVKGATSDRGHQPLGPGPGPAPGRGRYTRGPALEPRRCFECNKVGHMRDCPQLKESPTTSQGVSRQVTTTGQLRFQGEDDATTMSTGSQDHLSPYLLYSDYDDDDSGSVRLQGTSRQITVSELNLLQENEENSHHQLSQYLASSDPDDDSEVRQVRLTDRGSRPQYADIQVQGVPARGVINTGSDITIIGGELFRHVATVARLRKNHLCKADKIPKTYDGRTFTLDGMMDLDLSFDGVTMKTPIYIRASATEQLLLEEGACRQLQIITYHHDVSDRKGRKWHPPAKVLPSAVVEDRSTCGASENDSAAAERKHPREGTQRESHARGEHPHNEEETKEP